MGRCGPSPYAVIATSTSSAAGCPFSDKNEDNPSQLDRGGTIISAQVSGVPPPPRLHINHYPFVFCHAWATPPSTGPIYHGNLSKNILLHHLLAPLRRGAGEES
ncbi:hypothetical protein AAFF_G00096370 [Aldrovandia affinis]|uniref:Uncharacterized protein n=1 Tax=Aldrovandia affinis TaxID=143900 RepID=A0AAD7RVQ1_9TELE|nr:hypothetical protein AAFF_G00096370 [Aldrovandia affinis]